MIPVEMAPAGGGGGRRLAGLQLSISQRVDELEHV